MLVLTRKQGEQIRIIAHEGTPNEQVLNITLTNVGSKQAKLGFEGPMKVLRTEIIKNEATEDSTVTSPAS